MTLSDCLHAAMQHNHRRPASQFAVAMAEAQHREALAGYWPQINVSGGYQRMDQAPDFLFPGTTMAIPAQSISTPSGVATVTIPAGAFGNPAPIQLPVTYPGQTINVPEQQYAVPAQDVKLMDPDSFTADLSLTWLVYDGGTRKGLREQASGLLAAVKEEARRTDLQIADSVTRYYYSAVLARQVLQIGQDTLERMETTLSLTKSMYQASAGKVTKSDYLDNKVMVDTLRSVVALLQKNKLMAQAALANTMGLPWNASIEPADQKLPFTNYTANLASLVGTAYQFNPDWGKVEAGIRAAAGAVREARSGYFPKVAITGDLHKWWNNYDAGIATDANKEGWTVGVGVSIPLFDGFLTRNKVAAMRARLAKIKEQQILLKQGIGLQIRNVVLGLDAAQHSYQATLDAMQSATENRKLNIRAYENELVDTEKVIRAQLVEAVMSAQHWKTCYDCLALQSRLNLLVGTQVLKRLDLAR